jgi:hypothetical protein
VGKSGFSLACDGSLGLASSHWQDGGSGRNARGAAATTATSAERLRAHYQKELDDLRQKAAVLRRRSSPVGLHDRASPSQSPQPAQQPEDARDAVLFVHGPAAAAEGNPAADASQAASGREASHSDADWSTAGEQDEVAAAGGVATAGRTLADEEAATKKAQERAAMKAARLAARAKATSERAAAGLGVGEEDLEDGDSSETVSELSDAGEDDEAEWWVPRIMKGAAWVKVTSPPSPH